MIKVHFAHILLNKIYLLLIKTDILIGYSCCGSIVNKYIIWRQATSSKKNIKKDQKTNTVFLTGTLTEVCWVEWDPPSHQKCVSLFQSAV